MSRKNRPFDTRYSGCGFGSRNYRKTAQAAPAEAETAALALQRKIAHVTVTQGGEEQEAKMQLKPINEQVVAVVGASSGIGRAAALAFAQRGAKVVAAARGEPGLRSLVDEVRQAGGEADYVVADVAHYDEVKAIADRAVERFGRLDTWVGCAAVSVYAIFEHTTPEEFKQVIDVNLLGQAYGAMVALPHLKREGRGALIHISSVEGRRALPYHRAYAASKHGIIGFLDALRLELQHENVPINVTAIMPASINTPFFNKARTKIGVKPMGMPPIYQPDIVVDAILYAAEHEVRDIVVGVAGKVISMTQRLAPRTMDTMLERTAFEGQKTDEPKRPDDPNALFEPIAGYDRVTGDFGSQALQRSAATWMDTHPAARDFALGAAAVAGVAYLVRALRS
jgi:NAD(P)-dependent dehydrogenase (short-subunit alcohol dehydrogenase family)